MLQRFGKLARMRLSCLEQAHVLDRDDRLVGEGRDQVDLALGERLSGTDSTVRISAIICASGTS
jgi:hypothetical protein